MRIDLSVADTTRFEIAYPPKPGTTDPVVEGLDFDEIAMDIQTAMPTIMAAQDESIVFPPEKPGEEPKTVNRPNGLQYILYCAVTGRPTPEHLPNMKSVFLHLRRIFRVPDHCGPMVVRRALEAWGQEQNRRAALKKNSPA